MKLKPITSDYKKLRNRWWQFARFGKDMREAIEPLSRVLVRALTSEYHMMVFAPRGIVYSHAVGVFAFEDYYHFALLQSWAHEVWLRRQASTMRTDIRYTPTDCFQTFPFPQDISEYHQLVAEQAGRTYYEYRQQIMQQTQLGLTKTYNRFHNLDFQDLDIQKMRRLHADMDRAVLACYGWDDIDLQHDFYPNDRKKIRYMPSREAQREIFTRLLALNQEIAAQEAAQGIVSEAEEEETDEDENDI